MHFCNRAWNNVPVSVIKNSFKKEKFLKPNYDEDDCWNTEIEICDLQEFHEEIDKLQITKEELLKFIKFEKNEVTEIDEVSETSVCTEENENIEVAIYFPHSRAEYRNHYKLCEVEVCTGRFFRPEPDLSSMADFLAWPKAKTKISARPKRKIKILAQLKRKIEVLA